MAFLLPRDPLTPTSMPAGTLQARIAPGSRVVRAADIAAWSEAEGVYGGPPPLSQLAESWKSLLTAPVQVCPSATALVIVNAAGHVVDPQTGLPWSADQIARVGAKVPATKRL